MRKDFLFPRHVGEIMLKRKTLASKKAPRPLSTGKTKYVRKSLTKLTSKVSKNLKGQLLATKKLFIKSLSLQAKQRSNFDLVLKPFVLALPLVIYLFVSPHTSVQANFEEKVIPQPIAKISTVIRSSVVAEKIPEFLAPVHSYISTYFSRFHHGIDLPNPVGAPIAAAEDGEVIFSGWVNTGHGNLLIIRHAASFETSYAHLSSSKVTEGQKVLKGETIGTVGSTGNSTGSHLHFEIHQSGIPMNPLKYITP